MVPHFVGSGIYEEICDRESTAFPWQEATSAMHLQQITYRDGAFGICLPY